MRDLFDPRRWTAIEAGFWLAMLAVVVMGFAPPTIAALHPASVTCTDSPDFYLFGPNAGRAAIYRSCKVWGVEVRHTVRPAPESF